MTFPDVELKPGERIVIRFSAHIDPNSQADTPVVSRVPGKLL